MAKQTFEAAMRRLEEIVTELEDAELSLDDSLKVYEEGLRLMSFCNAKLDESEQKIKTLLRNGDNFTLADSNV